MNEKRRLTRGGIIYSDPIGGDPDHHLVDLGHHISRARKLFEPIQPSNLEYELIRQKIANQEARERLGCFT